MRPVFVLVHSPPVGPSTWRPVADQLTQAGYQVRVPSLSHAVDEQRIPVPDGWDDHPCAYLLFGPPYDVLAVEARERGWRVARLPGAHLHQVVDPAGTARQLIKLGSGL